MSLPRLSHLFPTNHNDRALLTGESFPVAKDHEATWDEKQSGDPQDVAIGDRMTMAFSSTTVTKGRALGVVVATGMKVRLQVPRGEIELKQITD